MQAENYFKPARVFLLVRNTIILNRSSILVITSALAGVLILFSFFNAYGDANPQFHFKFFLMVFFPGGILITSRIFKDLHDPVKGYSWLLLPASVLEKTLSCILLTTVVYMVGSMMFYLLFSIISEGLNMLVLGSCHPLFNPFDPAVLKSMQIYISIQTPFLIGAIYFKKHALSKTILFLFFLLIVFSSGIGITAWFLFGEDLSGLIKYINFTTFSLALINTAKVFFWFVVPLLSWAICYFRLKEAEL